MKRLSSTLLCLALICMTVNSAFSQVYELIYGTPEPDYGNKIIQTSDGNFIIAGVVNGDYNESTTNACLMKVTPHGQVLWVNTYDANSDLDWFNDMIQGEDSSLVVTGHCKNCGATREKLYLLKATRNGDPIWSITNGGADLTYSWGICFSQDGKYVVTGSSTDTDPWLDVILVKFDTNGTQLWKKYYSRSFDDTGNDVKLTSDGGFIIAGRTGLWSASPVAWIIKTDSLGTMEWNKVFGDTTGGNAYCSDCNWEWANAIEELPTGEYIITGRNYDPSSGFNLWLFKISATGELIWERFYGGNGYDEGMDVRVLPSGGFLVSGQTTLTNGNNQAWVLFTDAMGLLDTSYVFGGALSDKSNSIIDLGNETFAFTGWTNSCGSGDKDIWYVHYIESGTVTITASSDTVCQGDTVCITATISNGGSDPSLKWFINGDPDNGLVAWYPFNGNAQDQSGNGLHGKVNGATLTTDRFGNPESAYHFNGTSDNIEVVDNPLIRFSSSFTISLWVMMDNPYIMNYNMTPVGKAWESEWKNSYVIYTGVWGGGDTMTNAGYWSTIAGEDIYSNVALNINIWHNITWVMDRAVDTGYLYIDGSLVNNKVNSVGNLAYDIHPLTFGCDIHYGSNAEFFPGKIDDIRLYDRALSPQEVHAIYSEGDTTFCYVPTDQDTVYCIVNSGDTCVINTSDTSNYIIITVNTPDTVQVYITSSSDSVCAGDTVCFTATLENGGTNPVYQWNVNGGVREGLVAWYPFASNANDESGNGNHGTVYGATLTNDRYGHENSAYIFDGDDDYIVVPNAPSLDITQEITVAYWIKLETSAPYYYPYHIIEKYGSWFSVQRTWDINCSIYSSTNIWYTGLIPDDYYFFVMTFDGSSFNVYKDGFLFAEEDYNGTLPSTTSDITIGQYYLGGDYFLDGTIDDIRIYSRALSQGEILQLYSDGDTSFCYVPENGDTVSLFVTSNQPCITNNPDTSNLIIITVNQPDTVEVTIAASANPVCAGDTVCFTATIENGGSNPSFQWYINGNLNEGLIAWYPLDSNITDMSGNGYNGTEHGTSYTVDRFNRPNKAGLVSGNVGTNGSCKYFEIPNVINGLQQFTISIWIDEESMSYWHGNFYISFGEYFGLGHIMNTQSMQDRLDIAVRTATSGIVEEGYPFLPSFLNEFQHYVLTFNGNLGTFSCYQNTVLKLTGSIDPGVAYAPGIGAGLGWGSYSGCCTRFNGTIDDVRIYNRVLSEQEITSLFFEDDSTFCYVPSNNDTVYLVIISDQPCVTNNPDTSNLLIMTVDSIPNLSLSDTNYACSLTMILDAGSSAGSYLWSTTETTQSISVTATGWYWYTATNGSCSTSDTIFVDLIHPEIVPDDKLLCSLDTLQLTLVLEGGPTTCTLQSFLPSLQQGLVAYYPFCGDASDQSGNGHHGTLSGPVPTNDRFIKDTSAYDFPGINEYISLPSSIAINDNFSIGFWINTTAICPFTFAGYMFIIDRDLCGPMPDWSIGLGNGGKIVFNTGVSGGENILSSVTDINDGIWHHILVVKDGNQNQKRIYIDGVLDAFAAFVGSFTNLSEPIYLGASVCGTPTHIFFDGLLDDVTFHNRVLTPLEIASLQMTRNVLWSTGEMTPSIIVTPHQDTTYWVTVWDNVLTCSDTMYIQIDTVAASITGDTLICEGDTTVLTATGGSTYLWSTGSASDTLVVYQTGNYWVEATGPHGCVDTAWTNVTVNPSPIVTLNLCITITSRDAKPYPLRGGLPLGGTYSGSAVQGGILYPSIVPIGQNTINIQYHYTNAFDCTDSVIQSLEVFPGSNHICGNPFTDVRDNKIYSTILFGGTCWMAQNLNNGTHITASQYQMDNCLPEKYCYQEATANCTNFGGLYQWEELMQYSEADTVQGLCPPGWHVPTETDWQALITLFQDPAHAGTPLKLTGGGGFNGLLQGFVVNPSFHKYGANDTILNSSLFWTSTICSPGKVWAHGLNTVLSEQTFTTSVSSYSSSAANAFSVRCVRD